MVSLGSATVSVLVALISFSRASGRLKTFSKFLGGREFLHVYLNRYLNVN